VIPLLLQRADLTPKYINFRQYRLGIDQTIVVRHVGAELAFVLDSDRGRVILRP
jgi:hypothetical protein